MELETYDIKAWDKYSYTFYSEGPNGRIKKGINFQRMEEIGINVFNLAFGDVDESTGRINDLSISNNNDRLKILMTVAEAVIDFIQSVPNAIIIIKGSTLSRTRLYQMGISSFWSEIKRHYNIYGNLDNKWLPFQKGVNYERFLLFKKN